MDSLNSFPEPRASGMLSEALQSLRADIACWKRHQMPKSSTRVAAYLHS